MQQAMSSGIADAVEQGAPMPSDVFLHQLGHSADVFSAFRVHRMQNDVARQMIDENGHLKPFSKFQRDVQPYLSHRNKAWLRTEYDTAVRRAHQAADWQRFEAEKDVMPNLEWVQSTSPNPGADHMVYWGTVRPVDDGFWDEHRPGDRWNCKCELRQTDRDATVPPMGSRKDNPQDGLENNPGKDGSLFSQEHPYYPDGCLSCPFAGNRLVALFHDLAHKQNCHQCQRVNKCIERSKRRVAKKKKLETLNPRTNIKEFKAAQREIIAELRHRGELEKDGKQFYTGHLFFGRREFKRIKEHCFDGLEIEAAKHLHTLIPKIRNGKYIPIDMSRANYKLKMQEGVRNYVAYEIEYKGDIFVLKCQVRRDGKRVREYPYSLKRKE